MAEQTSRGAGQESHPQHLAKSFFFVFPPVERSLSGVTFIDRSPSQRLLVLTLLLICGNVHSNPDPFRSTSRIAAPLQLPQLRVPMRSASFLCDALIAPGGTTYPVPLCSVITSEQSAQLATPCAGSALLAPQRWNPRGHLWFRGDFLKSLASKPTNS